jgi:hypothetical protein
MKRNPPSGAPVQATMRRLADADSALKDLDEIIR